MIILLHTDSGRAFAEMVALNLVEAFKDHVEVNLNNASSPSLWPTDCNWDDLLVIIFDETRFPDAGNDFVAEYQAKRGENALLLPVALKHGHTHPPKAAEAIKALEFDAAASGVNGRLVKRIGAMLGFRIQQRDAQIFISYRASDGTAIAKQIEQRLTSMCYPVWRDEAKELDGETKILPGTPVQKQIDEGLERASMVLLVDTPDAPHSRWITHEVDTANGLLVPILPLCFRLNSDHKKGPRFQSLLHLQRWVSLPLANPPPVPPLIDDELTLIVNEMESYLCELFQRKCRVPFIVEKEFVSRSFSWKILDRRLLVGESIKGQNSRVPTKVLSHCSIFDQVHGPAMDAFSAFLRKTGRPNHSLYIYDGELIPEPQLLEIIKNTPSEDGVVILHHQELATLIDSNFTTLSL